MSGRGCVKCTCCRVLSTAMMCSFGKQLRLLGGFSNYAYLGVWRNPCLKDKKTAAPPVMSDSSK